MVAGDVGAGFAVPGSPTPAPKGPARCYRALTLRLLSAKRKAGPCTAVALARRCVSA